MPGWEVVLNRRDFDHVTGILFEDVLKTFRECVMDEPLSMRVSSEGARLYLSFEVDHERDGEPRMMRTLVVPLTVRGSDIDLDQELAGLPGLSEREQNLFRLLASSELTRSPAVVTLGDLLRQRRSDLLRMRGVGPVTVRDVEAVLARFGLWLGARVAEGGAGVAGGGV